MAPQEKIEQSLERIMYASRWATGPNLYWFESGIIGAVREILSGTLSFSSVLS
jgi:hypothetical protein